MQKFIFDGSSASEVSKMQEKRRIAEALRKANTQTPRNVGEGMHAIARALAARKHETDAGAARDKLLGQFGNDPEAIAKLMGIPGFKRGTRNAPGGLALVGEEGPEIVNLPKGSQVIPNLGAYDPESQKRLMREYQDNGMMPPPDENPGGMFWQEDSRFDDSKAYQTADLAGITPSGVGEQNNINNAAYAYRTLMSNLEDYNDTVQSGGVPLMPGPQKDRVKVAHRNLQMQMKELYNLGVLNGPDLALMNEILMVPTGIGNKILDATGIADTEERVGSNVEQVKKLMTNMVEPKLKAIGIKPEDLLQQSEQEKPDLSKMSDDEILKQLLGQ